MSTLKCSNLQNASAASPAIVLAADGSATANLSSVNGGPIAGSRNRIINGDMRIDQRNAGASVNSASGGGVYAVDRFEQESAVGGGVMSIQRSSTAPAGFTNSLLFTVTTTDTSLAAGDKYDFRQIVEGFNTADLGFGTASPSTVTLSFWIRSSVTGTYCVALRNGSNNRSYVTTYAINSANTWEQKSVTITGDTTGTWGTDNGRGIIVGFSLGAGSTFQATANTWSAGEYRATSSQTNLLATNGATFYITGVQLEPGSTATPFERRSYGQELALCQRYYQTSYAAGVAIQAATGVTDGATFVSINTSDSANGGLLPVTMRATPTFAIYSTIGGTGSPSARDNSGGITITGISLNGGTTTNLPRLSKTSGLPATGASCSAQYTASSEL